MLKTRVITALFLLTVFALALFVLPQMAWALFCGVLIALAAWEWSRLSGMQGMLATLYPVVSAGAFLLVSSLSLTFVAGLMFTAALFWLLLVPLWLRKKWRLAQAGNLNALLGWALLFPAGLAMLILRGNGKPLLAVMAIAWVADSFAYFVGRRWGKNKLAPGISPGKSWEGVYGGILAVVVYILLLPKPFTLFSFAPVSWLGQNALWLCLAIALTAVSIMGDLLESLFKRQAGMKDSSNLLPGHGGILDRVDSQLAVLPLAASVYLLHLFVLV